MDIQVAGVMNKWDDLSSWLSKHIWDHDLELAVDILSEKNLEKTRVLVYIHTYIYTHTYIYIYIHTCMHVCVHKNAYIVLHTYEGHMSELKPGQHHWPG